MEDGLPKERRTINHYSFVQAIAAKLELGLSAQIEFGMLPMLTITMDSKGSVYLVWDLVGQAKAIEKTLAGENEPSCG